MKLTLVLIVLAAYTVTLIRYALGRVSAPLAVTVVPDDGPREGLISGDAFGARKARDREAKGREASPTDARGATAPSAASERSGGSGAPSPSPELMDRLISALLRDDLAILISDIETEEDEARLILKAAELLPFQDDERILIALRHLISKPGERLSLAVGDLLGEIGDPSLLESLVAVDENQAHLYALAEGLPTFQTGAGEVGAGGSDAEAALATLGLELETPPKRTPAEIRAARVRSALLMASGRRFQAHRGRDYAAMVRRRYLETDASTDLEGALADRNPFVRGRALLLAVQLLAPEAALQAVERALDDQGEFCRVAGVRASEMLARRPELRERGLSHRLRDLLLSRLMLERTQDVRSGIARALASLASDPTPLTIDRAETTWFQEREHIRTELATPIPAGAASEAAA